MRRVLTSLAFFLLLSLPALASAQGEGIIEVTANADGAAVFIDGSLVGQTPLTEIVESGTHVVRVEHPSFDPWEESVSVAVDTMVTLAAELARVRAGLNIRVDVPGARVLLDGQQVGVGDVTLDPVRAGRHSLVVVTDDYGRYERTIRIPEGRLSLVEVAIRGSAGSLAVETQPSGAKVFIDGQSQGRTPLNLSSIAPGSHGVKVVASGRSMVLENVRVEPGESKRLSLELVEQGGHINLRLNQERGKVSINGVEFGQGTQEIGPLKPGTYSLRITAPGHLDFLQDVQVEADRSARVVARLQAFDLGSSGGGKATAGRGGGLPIHKRPGFWVGVGAGGAAVVTAIIVGAVRSSQALVPDPVPGTPAPPATFTFSLP